MPEPVHNMDDAPVMLATRLSTSPPLVLATDLFETGYEAPHVMLDEPLCPCPAGQKTLKSTPYSDFQSEYNSSLTFSDFFFGQGGTRGGQHRGAWGPREYWLYLRPNALAGRKRGTTRAGPR
jgi:hypothetical protein